MTALPNPFLSDSTANTCDVESAVASKPSPAADATAAQNSALASAMTADTAAGPDFTDPPVPAAVLIADPDGGYMGHRLSPALGTSVGSAVASKPSPAADATAAPFAGSVEQSTRDNLDGPTPLLRSSEILGSGASSDFPSSTGGPQEASAPAPTKNPDADALGTDCIHEIFAGAAKIDDYRFDAEFDEHAFVYAIEAGEEVPLFIRDGADLRRWSA